MTHDTKLRVLAVDDERPALEDLGRLLESSPAVEAVVLADGGGRGAGQARRGQLRRRVRGRADAGRRRARARRRAEQVRRPAGARIRVRVRGRRRRRLRARPAPARLPDEAGFPQPRRAGPAASAGESRGDVRRPRWPPAHHRGRDHDSARGDHRRDHPGRASARRRHPAARSARRSCTSRPRAITSGSTPTAVAISSARRCRTSSSGGDSTGSCACIAATSRTSAAR